MSRICSNIRVALILVLTTFSCGSGLFAQQEKPFDLFEQPIDNRVIYRHFERRATGMMQSQAEDAVASFQEELLQAPRSSDIVEASLTSQRAAKPSEVYRHMVKSTVYIGELYNCGRCDRTHAGFSGGVVVSEDGLVLTNYHVLESRDTGKTEGIYAMTWDGKCWAVDEILAASKNDDVALVRLKGKGHKFYASPVAAKAPVPMDPIRIVSHPFGEFFVMTHGEVSRYARMRKKRDSAAAKKATWMEVTAPFGSGSSGCGVFNNRGEVVGLVSSIRPLFRKPSQSNEREPEAEARSPYVEMLIRKCVPLDAIDACFASPR
ncbi:MAG: serine protease [Pirellulaceae bacterium]|nr:serine protease [Pirellulaceae bacterium]